MLDTFKTNGQVHQANAEISAVLETWSGLCREQLQTACRCGPAGQLLMSDSIMFPQIPLWATLGNCSQPLMASLCSLLLWFQLCSWLLGGQHGDKGCCSTLGGRCCLTGHGQCRGSAPPVIGGCWVPGNWAHALSRVGGTRWRTWRKGCFGGSSGLKQDTTVSGSWVVIGSLLALTKAHFSHCFGAVWSLSSGLAQVASQLIVQ